MLVIRMQRTGRKGHAMFRVVVQDSRRTPTSGKVVASLGSYDPHSKAVTLNKEKAAFYIEHGAQPSPRVVRILQSEGVKLPDWVKQGTTKEGAVRNADKRRSTRPAEAAPAEPEAMPEEPAEAPAAEPASDTAEATETLSDETAETVAEEAADSASTTDSETVETPAEAASATAAEEQAADEVKEANDAENASDKTAEK